MSDSEKLHVCHPFNEVPRVLTGAYKYLQIEFAK